MSPTRCCWTATVALLLAVGASVPPMVATAVPMPPTNQLFGFISENTTLTATTPGPVYYVHGDLVVQPGVTLTIEPGVTLRFTANTDTLQGGDYTTRAELYVRGSVVADAAFATPIRFESSAGGTAEWGQVKLDPGANAQFNNVNMQGPVRAFFIRGGGSRTLQNVHVTGCGAGVDASTSDAAVMIRQCSFEGYGFGDGLHVGNSVEIAASDSLDPAPTVVSGFNLGIRFTGTDPQIRNLLTRDNNFGMATNNSSAMIISYCTVVRNTTEGVAFSGPTNSLLNSIVALNGLGARNAHVDYTNIWSNSYTNLTLGPQVASFNPFFVDPGSNDFRLEPHSIFKSYSNSGGEIGAYGPGPGLPTGVTERSSWGRLKALYR